MPLGSPSPRSPRVLALAFSSPDLFENHVNRRSRVTHLTRAAYGPSSARCFVQTRGPGNLDQEHMRSRELGYNGFFAEWSLAMDMKLFYDDERRAMYFSTELAF